MKIKDLKINPTIKARIMLAGFSELEELKDFSDSELRNIRFMNEDAVKELRAVIDQFFPKATLVSLLQLHIKQFDAEQYEAAMETLADAVNLGYTGDYSIISQYYISGINGTGGKQWENAFIWLTRFYNDYVSGRLKIENNTIPKAQYHFQLALLNGILLDSIGSKDDMLKHFSEYIGCATAIDESTFNMLPVIFSMTLGYPKKVEENTVEGVTDIPTAMHALIKHTALGDTGAKKMTDHIIRDELPLDTPDTWFSGNQDKQIAYLKGIGIYYEYIQTNHNDSVEEILKVVFGTDFCAAQYFEQNKQKTTHVGRYSFIQADNNVFVYRFPPITLLRNPESVDSSLNEQLRSNALRIQYMLSNFAVGARITNIVHGPAFTRYELELDKGVRLREITSLEEDIALGLGKPYATISPVLGKYATVGITVPNDTCSKIGLRMIIDTKEFVQDKKILQFGVGQNSAGENMIADMSKLSHLLIAARTNTCLDEWLNAFIASFLYSYSPDELKFIISDSSTGTFSKWNDLPHLLLPLQNDSRKVVAVLSWLANESKHRYSLLSAMHARNIEAYNNTDGVAIKLPRILMIIREIDDLMQLSSREEVEENLIKVAQIGRGVGVHLVIITEKITASNLTPALRSHIPSRIAFCVATPAQSRLIIGCNGAEKLAGNGDMLYYPSDYADPMRVQGCLVSDEEASQIADYLRTQFPQSKNTAIDSLHRIKYDCDECFPDAVDVILEHQLASVSFVQRALNIGYARAARIIDEMEQLGFIGEFQGSHPREILITKTRWNSIRKDFE